MDLAQRLTILESVHDWHTLADELEKAIGAEADATRKATLFLKLGRVLEERFPEEVHNGYLEFLKDSFRKSEILRTYMDDHREWTGWYNKLAPYRPDLRRRPDGTYMPVTDTGTKTAATARLRKSIIFQIPFGAFSS